MTKPGGENAGGNCKDKINCLVDGDWSIVSYVKRTYRWKQRGCTTAILGSQGTDSNTDTVTYGFNNPACGRHRKLSGRLWTKRTHLRKLQPVSRWEDAHCYGHQGIQQTATKMFPIQQEEQNYDKISPREEIFISRCPTTNMRGWKVSPRQADF